MVGRARQGETRILGVAATGAGKTVMAAFLIEQLLKVGQRVLFVVHRDILIAQTLDKVEKLGLKAGVIAGRRRENRCCSLQIASVQTLSRRNISWFPFKVAFFDECHLTSWAAPSLKLFPPLGDNPRDAKACVGLTATPWRTSSLQSMGNLYRQVVLAPLPSELLKSSYLTKPVYYPASRQPDLSGVRLVNGDYDKSQLSRCCSDPTVIQAVVEAWQQRARGRITIAFAVDVAHARAISESFSAKKIPAAWVDGTMSFKEREKRYSALSEGNLLVLASCEALAEGFDVPAVSCVLLARPTQSRAKYVQQLGRGLRLADDKTDCLVLDAAGLVLRFGFIEDLTEEDFTLNPSQTGKSRPAPVKGCPKCERYLPSFHTSCPHCRHQFPPPPKYLPQAGEFQRVLHPIDAERMAALHTWLKQALSKGFDPTWANHRYRDKYGQLPPDDWLRGALYGENPSRSSFIEYEQRLVQIGQRARLSATQLDSWVQKHLRAEFGADLTRKAR